MATTTPNFGWQVPTSTDYVKDGAVAIETLGDAIDASLVDLKGGTTGQVLSKNTNTDMDFTWVTPNDADAIQNTIVDAKGDLITATAADTPARLGVGANGEVLTADSTAATGLKWSTVSSGGASWALLNAGGTALTGATTVTVSGIASTVKGIMVLIAGASAANGNNQMKIRVNSLSGASDYYSQGLINNYGGSANVVITDFGGTDTGIPFGKIQNAGDAIGAYCFINDTNGTGLKTFHVAGTTNSTVQYGQSFWLGGYINTTSAISSVSIVSASGNLDAGTFYVYGAS